MLKKLLKWLKRAWNGTVDWLVWYWPTVFQTGAGTLALAVLFLLIFAKGEFDWSGNLLQGFRDIQWVSESQGVLDGIRNYGLAVAGVVAAFLGFSRLKQQQDSHIVDAMAKATEQLKSDDVTIKLLAISQLWRIAADDPRRYHIPVMEALTHSVRAEGLAVSMKPRGIRPNRLSEQTAAVLDRLRNRSEKQLLVERRENYYVDLRGAFLKKGDISSAQLEKAYFDDANLQHVRLNGSNCKGATFHRADLGKAWIGQTQFQDAQFHDATMIGAHAGQSCYDRASFTKANLGGSSFLMSSFESATFYHAMLPDTDLRKTNFVNADLRGVNLSKAKLQEADFSGGVLWGVNFRNAEFEKTRLNRANITNAVFEHSDITDEQKRTAIIEQGVRPNAPYPHTPMVTKVRHGNIVDI